MTRSLVLFGLVVALAAPAGAQSPAGMAALQYYVGTWSCTAGAIGQAPSKATATYTIDSGIMRAWIYVPMQGKMKHVYAFNAATTYDAKHGRYVESVLDSDSAWSISTAKPWTANTEDWTDQYNSTGKLMHAQTVRTNHDNFSFTGYPSLTAAKPDFKGSCSRSS